MNKNGELRITVVQLVITIIIFVIIVLGVSYFFKENIFPFGRNLPNPIVEIGGGGASLEIVRYIINRDEVEYYTGIEWVLFEKEGSRSFLDFKQKDGSVKKVNSFNLKNNFRSYYYQERARESVVLDGERKALIEKIYSGPVKYSGTEELRGYVIAEYDTDYIINYDGKLYKRTGSPVISLDEAGSVDVRKISGNAFDEQEEIIELVIKKDKNGYKLSIGSVKEHLDNLNGMRVDSLTGLPKKVQLDKGYEMSFIESNERSATYAVYASERKIPVEIEFSFLKEKGIEKVSGGKVKAEAEFEKKYKLVDKNKQAEYEKKLIEEAILWRDRIFEKPVVFSYEIAESGKQIREERKAFCIKKILHNGRESLIVYLDKPMGENTKCLEDS